MFTVAEDAANHVEETSNEAVEVEAAEVVVEDAAEGAADAAQSTDEKDAQIADLEQQLLRARADFDNFRRRTRQEKEELGQYATKKLLADLLPVVDNFDRAMDVISEVQDEQMKAGIEMVHRQFVQVLSQYGVVAMQTVGEAFDPTRHEAVMQEAAEGTAPNTVIQELQKGYTLHEKILRPAMVKVSV